MTYLISEKSTGEQTAAAITALVNRGAITDLFGARLALEGLYQRVANHSMSSDDRRGALQSARMTAAMAADPSELSPSLRAIVAARKEREAAEAARLAAAKKAFEDQRQAEAAALTEDDIANMIARLPALKERENSRSKSARKRARQQMRRIYDLLRRRGIEAA